MPKSVGKSRRNAFYFSRFHLFVLTPLNKQAPVMPPQAAYQPPKAVQRGASQGIGPHHSRQNPTLFGIYAQNDRGTACQNEFFPGHPLRFPVLLSVFPSSCSVFRPPARFPILLPLFLASCLFLRRSERSEGSAVQSEIFLFCSRGSSSWYSLDALISSYNKPTRRLMVNRNRAKGIRPIRYALTTKP